MLSSRQYNAFNGAIAARGCRDHELTFIDRQVYKNYKAQSAEGLALPFLANWLAGVYQSRSSGLSTHLMKRRCVELDRLLAHETTAFPGD